MRRALAALAMLFLAFGAVPALPGAVDEEPRRHAPGGALRRQPQSAKHWGLLGIAQYRAGDFPAAVEALNRALGLVDGGDALHWTFLAMAHRQLGDRELARAWYDHAVDWMDKHSATNEELRRFRAEATDVLGLAGLPTDVFARP